jgi:starvation-inducible DNA-binding protein
MTTAAPTKTSILDRLGTDAASAADFASQLKEAHWVITGPNFIALHELFDRQTEMMRGHVDALAERMRQLDGVPHGTIRQAAERTQLPDFPDRVMDEREVVRTLVDRYEAFAECVKQSANAAGEDEDIATEDLYVEILRAVNLQRWFLESHLEGR